MKKGERRFQAEVMGPEGSKLTGHREQREEAQAKAGEVGHGEFSVPR